MNKSKYFYAKVLVTLPVDKYLRAKALLDVRDVLYLQ